MSETNHAIADPELRNIYEEAIKAIPFPNLQSTGISDDYVDDEQIEYSEEHTFTAGTLVGAPLEAAGWITLCRDSGGVTISALFNVAYNGEWNHKDARVLSENHAILAQYKLDTKTWGFRFEAI